MKINHYLGGNQVNVQGPVCIDVLLMIVITGRVMVNGDSIGFETSIAQYATLFHLEFCISSGRTQKGTDLPKRSDTLRS